MKVALIQCPGWGRDCPPHTIALLSAWLRRAGHKAYGFDLNNALYLSGPDKYKKFWDDKDLYSFWNQEALISEFLKDNARMLDFQINKILDTGAKIIGFTVHFTSLLVSLEVAKMIKAKDKERIIVFGGPHAYRDMEGNRIIKDEAVDIVVTGEGELTMLDLIEAAEKSDKIEFCRGTLIKNEGEIIDCGDRPVIEDLDFTPFPDYGDFRKDILLGLYREPERLEIFDSRGCISCCHFCSEWQFWKTYRSMSGERIFEEIATQMRKFPGVNSFYFNGSLVNGDVKALSRFCDLVIQNNLEIRWQGQAIVRPEMTQELFDKMRKAGCGWLGIGIESGSQRIVNRMNKHFSINNAEEVLRYTHKSGISVQANIMFGIPGETEEDFKATLDFVKRNRENIDTILASQSFCVIDKGTYLRAHAHELGIKNADHHLYWEENGNTYPERFRRYEEFCQFALSLGFPETSGVLRVKPDKWLLLGDYYLFKEDYENAKECFESSLALESYNDAILRKIEHCNEELKKSGGHIKSAKPAGAISKMTIPLDGLTETQAKITNALVKRGREEKAKNYLLIEKEKAQRREYVYGYPYWLAIDPANFCHLRCPFCPTGQNRGSRTRGLLSLANYKRIMDELGPYLIHVDFCNWGEPLLNKQIFKMVAYAKEYGIDTKIDSNFNHFSKKTAEEMVLSGLDKVIASIDGTTPEAYATYRIGGDFHTALNNLKALVKKKKELGKTTPYVSWQFLVFRHNEHQLDDLKKMAQDVGVDHIGITKAFIGNKDWIPLNEEYSQYRRGEIASEYTFEHFKPPQSRLCNWPWEAIAINPNGSVSPCCSVEDGKDDFGNILTTPFRDVWNNDTYRTARQCIQYSVRPEENGNICLSCHHAGMINLDILSCHSLFD